MKFVGNMQLSVRSVKSTAHVWVYFLLYTFFGFKKENLLAYINARVICDMHGAQGTWRGVGGLQFIIYLFNNCSTIVFNQFIEISV